MENNVLKIMKKICRLCDVRMFSLIATGVILGSSLSACQQTTAPQHVVQAPKEPVSGITPSTFRLPSGDGCSGDVARYRAVMDNDLATGHVNTSVHARVTSEINQAHEVCLSGRDPQASAMIRSTQIKFGYKAGD